MNELTNHDLKNIEGYCALAAAIVRQVCKDYIAVEKKLLHGDTDGDITMDMLLQQRVLEDEMCSQFFSALTLGADPEVYFIACGKAARAGRNLPNASAQDPCIKRLKGEIYDRYYD